MKTAEANKARRRYAAHRRAGDPVELRRAVDTLLAALDADAGGWQRAEERAANWPPFTPEQRDALRLLFAPAVEKIRRQHRGGGGSDE